MAPMEPTRHYRMPGLELPACGPDFVPGLIARAGEGISCRGCLNALQAAAEPAPVPCTCSPTCSCGATLHWDVDPVDRTWELCGHDYSRESAAAERFYSELTRIGDAILAALTGPKSRRGPMPSWEEQQWYSQASMAASAHMTSHYIRPPSHEVSHDLDCQPRRFPMPWHCGLPMQYRACGWWCRNYCGAIFHPDQVTPKMVAEANVLTAELAVRLREYGR